MLASSLRRFIPLAGILLIIGYFAYIYDEQIWTLPRFGNGPAGLNGTPTASVKPSTPSTFKTSQPVPPKGDPKAFPPKKPVPPTEDTPKQDSPPSKQDTQPPPPPDQSQPLPSSKEQSKASPAKPPSSYREIFSVSRTKGNYFEIQFPGYNVFNPNILPHPSKPETWIVVAQKERGGGHDDFEAVELVCEAVFNDADDTLTCSTPPTALPVEPTEGGLCKGELEWFNGVSGPHDARVFYGPKVPYIIYGSRSGYTCFGQWIQDFRGLVKHREDKDEPTTHEKDAITEEMEVPSTGEYDTPSVNTDKEEKDTHTHTPNARSNSTPKLLFESGTELHRPGPFGEFEKNWFVFWDRHGQMYAHYDLAPRRSFARLDFDGSVIGDDLAPLAAASDEVCMAKYMPKTFSKTGERGERSEPGSPSQGSESGDTSASSEEETTGASKSSLHQATNSLSITLCNRADATCKPTADNTFILAVFQQKFYYAYHNVYRPYVVLFRPRAPFEIHAISQKPMWFHGHRKVATKATAQGTRRKRSDEVTTAKAKATGERSSVEQSTPEHFITKRRRSQDNELPENQAEMFFVTSIGWKQRGQTYHGYLDDVVFVTFGIEDNRAGAIDVRAGDLLQDLGVCGQPEAAE